MWNPFPPSPFKVWLPTLCLSCASFIFVTSELMPVGLLPDIAQGLDKTESFTGLVITGYAWVVAVLSLPLTVLSAKIERRKLMLTLLALFIAGNCAAGLVFSFGQLMAARVCIAMAHSVFWAIVTPLAARMAPEGKKGRALSIIIAGASLATILGVPLGTALGHALGWRLAFLLTAAAAVFVWLALLRFLPLLPSSNAGSFASLPALMRRPELVRMYLLTVFTVTGHFCAYTYINPFLQQIGGHTPGVVVMVLLFFGASGIFGSWLGGKYADKNALPAMFISLALVFMSLCMFAFVSRMLPAMVILALVWCTALTTANLICQTEVLNMAADAADVAIAIYSGIFNVGIGAGALIGGRVIISPGMGHIGYAGACFLAVSLLVGLSTLLRHSNRIKK